MKARSGKLDYPPGMAVRGSRVAAGALTLMVVASMTAPNPIRAADPPPVFSCTIPHASQSSALGIFATSLTVWTRVTDAPADHVAAVLWLEPPVVGALSGLAMARTSWSAATVAVRP